MRAISIQKRKFKNRIFGVAVNARGYVLSHTALWELASGIGNPTRAWFDQQQPQSITVSVVTVGWLLARISSSGVSEPQRRNGEVRVRKCADRFSKIGCLLPIDLTIADRWSQLQYVIIKGPDDDQADESCKWAWATALALDVAYVEHSKFDYGPMLASGLRIFDPVDGVFVGQ
jgi:hypothetical protein